MPAGNAREAALVAGVDTRFASSLRDVVQYLGGGLDLPRALPAEPMPSLDGALDLHDVRGQHAAKRALEIAAGGGHNLLMIGPPGTGKTMLAQRPRVSAVPTEREALEIATIASATGLARHQPRHRAAPLRAPQHGASHAALVGGGGRHPARRGSRRHNGVLFSTSAGVRTGPPSSRCATMESGLAAVARAHERVVWPARRWSSRR